jgi:hypothetical protein
MHPSARGVSSVEETPLSFMQAHDIASRQQHRDTAMDYSPRIFSSARILRDP